MRIIREFLFEILFTSTLFFAPLIYFTGKPVGAIVFLVAGWTLCVFLKIKERGKRNTADN